jgi:hypothetical protein
VDCEVAPEPVWLDDVVLLGAVVTVDEGEVGKDPLVRLPTDEVGACVPVL